MLQLENDRKMAALIKSRYNILHTVYLETGMCERVGLSEDCEGCKLFEGRFDDYIQEEQAQILKLRGLEQHRLRLAQELGWNSLTFSQILEIAEPAQVEQLSPCFYDLELQLKRLQQSRKAAEQIINVRIHELQVAIAKQEGSGYDNAGNINLNSPYRSKIRNTYV